MYKKERKKRAKLEPKPLVIEPVTISIDEKSMVEDENIPVPEPEPEPVPVPNNTKLLPKRRLPGLEIPENLKYHTGYNCFLAHENNTVRNSYIKINLFFFFYLLYYQYDSSWFSYLVNLMWLHCLKVTLSI